MSNEVYDFNIGHSTAYAYAKASGDLPEGMTPEEYGELLASYATVGQTAVTAAQTATTKASEAATSATTATNKASEATTAATTATTKAGEASTSASTATSAKDTAVSASQTATTKATEATTAAATATSAKTDAVAANTAAQSAKTAAQTAQTGAETAAASVQSSAEQIATNAEDISQLKSEITDKSDTADMLKAFPTDTATGAVASFNDGANVPLKSLIVNIDPVQSGSGDPSPNNVRPISGHTQAAVTRTGKNLFDKSAVLTGMWLSTTTGLEEAKGSYCVSDYIHVKSGETVYIPGSGTARRWFYDRYKNPVTYLNNSNNQAFTPLADGYIRVTIAVSGSDAKDLNTYQIEYGSTATAFEPYNGQSINIPLGQTVYGGTLDVVSGVLTVDYEHLLFDGSETWNLQSINSHGIANFTKTASVPSYATPIDLICNRLPLQTSVIAETTTEGIMPAGNTNIYIRLNSSMVSTVAELKQWLTSNNVEVVYKIRTPLTIQLTPHEVTALLGSNNVWADTGDSAVEYRADPTLYIQRLTEPDADMVADANITSGQYFMVGNTLYKATANIASGAIIAPNVNCTRKSLSEALNELSA